MDIFLLEISQCLCRDFIMIYLFLLAFICIHSFDTQLVRMDPIWDLKTAF